MIFWGEGSDSFSTLALYLFFVIITLPDFIILILLLFFPNFIIFILTPNLFLSLFILFSSSSLPLPSYKTPEFFLSFSYFFPFSEVSVYSAISLIYAGSLRVISTENGKPSSNCHPHLLHSFGKSKNSSLLPIYQLWIKH